MLVQYLGRGEHSQYPPKGGVFENLSINLYLVISLSSQEKTQDPSWNTLVLAN